MGSAGGLEAEINIIPMIDVLLVLLVIFMVAMAFEGKFLIDVPAPESRTSQATPPQIVLSLDSLGGYSINGSRVPYAGLGGRLYGIYKDRPVKLLFIRTAGQRNYGDLIDAVDIARGAGVTLIGYMP